MFIKELRLSISPLAKIGFKVGESYPPLVAENDAHRVTAFLQDRETFAIIDIALKTVARCTVDGYSIVAYFNPKALSAFIDSDSELTEEQIVPFIIGNLTGDCRNIFKALSVSIIGNAGACSAATGQRSLAR